MLAREMVAAHGDRGRTETILREHTSCHRATFAEYEQDVVARPVLDFRAGGA